MFVRGFDKLPEATKERHAPYHVRVERNDAPLSPFWRVLRRSPLARFHPGAASPGSPSHYWQLPFTASADDDDDGGRGGMSMLPGLSGDDRERLRRQSDGPGMSM